MLRIKGGGAAGKHSWVQSNKTNASDANGQKTTPLHNYLSDTDGWLKKKKKSSKCKAVNEEASHLLGYDNRKK